MNLIQIVVLSIVQGITEFLPVSSSGHLVIFEWLMGVTADQADVNIVLHFGTLLSIVIFYWQRIWQLLLNDRRVLGLLGIGTVPAVIAGLIIKTQFEHWLESPLLAGAMLPVTGALLLWVSGRDEGQEDYLSISWKVALLIGLFQALAILPGISRSGATIVAGLLMGMKRRSAATFSFLLAIPVMLGASLLECKDIWSAHGITTPIALLGLGAALSFAVGLFSLRWLVAWIEKGKLHYFAYWCIPVGVAVVVWQSFFAAPVDPAVTGSRASSRAEILVESSH